MKLNRIKKVTCPVCKAEKNTATHHGQRSPKPGSIDVCLYCQCISKYTENMNLRKLTDDELSILKADTQLWEYIQRSIRLAKKALEVKQQKYN